LDEERNGNERKKDKEEKFLTEPVSTRGASWRETSPGVLVRGNPDMQKRPSPILSGEGEVAFAQETDTKET